MGFQIPPTGVIYVATHARNLIKTLVNTISASFWRPLSALFSLFKASL